MQIGSWLQKTWRKTSSRFFMTRRAFVVYRGQIRRPFEKIVLSGRLDSQVTRSVKLWCWFVERKYACGSVRETITVAPDRNHNRISLSSGKSDNKEVEPLENQSRFEWSSEPQVPTPYFTWTKCGFVRERGGLPKRTETIFATDDANPIARLARASLLWDVTTGKLSFRYAFVQVAGSVFSTTVRVGRQRLLFRNSSLLNRDLRGRIPFLKLRRRFTLNNYRYKVNRAKAFLGWYVVNYERIIGMRSSKVWETRTRSLSGWERNIKGRDELFCGNFSARVN